MSLPDICLHIIAVCITTLFAACTAFVLFKGTQALIGVCS